MAAPDSAPRAPLMVSVVVCTYNRARFLPDCLASLAAQTADPATFEVLIVNNHSTDGTERIARDFLRARPRLRARYLLEEEQGLSHARNRGLAEAAGEVVTYVDDDAVAEPDFVERVRAFFTEHPGAAAVGGKVLARFEGERPAWFNPYSASLFFSHYDPGDSLFRYRPGQGYPIGCNMSIRKADLTGARGFNVRLGRKGKGGVGAEEKELFQTLFDQEKAIYFDPRQVVHHQIDRERTRLPYTRKLAFGLGQTHRRMYCADAWRLPCLRILGVTVAKFFGAVALGLGYALLGRRAVARHLIWYRWMVLRGFFA